MDAGYWWIKKKCSHTFYNFTIVILKQTTRCKEKTHKISCFSNLIEGHIIVTKVKPYSVAGEDEKIEVGDNPVSIDNVILFDLSPEFIAKMIKRLAGRVPITISVAKARDPKNKVYPMMVPYLKYAGIDPVIINGKTKI